MPAGRPTIYSQEILDKLKSLITIFSPKNKFISEAKMCNLIESNMEHFCRTYLKEELLDYKREYRVGIADLVRSGIIRPRTDFLINTKTGKRIALECKNSTRLQDFAQGIMQLLIYRQIEEFDRLILVTSNFASVSYNLIERYNLPVEIILLNKDNIAYNE